MAEDSAHTAPTLFLLMAQYNGQTVVPLDRVCHDFFGHLTVENRRPNAACTWSILPPISTSAERRRSRNAASFAERHDEPRYDRPLPLPPVDPFDWRIFSTQCQSPL